MIQLKAPSEVQSIDREGCLLGKTILLIDDSTDLCLLYQRIIETEGAMVTTTNTAQQGIALALTRNFDLVVMDIEMPIITGLEAASMLRRAGFNRPLVALSGHSDDDHKLAAQNAGYDGYLCKDGDTLGISERLKPWLGC